MCHFLSISLPRQSIPDVPEKFRREIQFVEHRNASIVASIPPHWISFLVISGSCSCGFYQADATSSEDALKMAAKYRKKGWNEVKIQRAIETQSNAGSSRAGLRDDIRGLIAQLVKDVGQLRLSLHWYSGDTATEKFRLHDLGIISLDEFLRDPSVFRDESTIIIHRGGVIS